MVSDSENSRLPAATSRPADPFGALSQKVHRLANSGVLRAEFLRETSGMFLEISCCDVVEMRIRERNRHFRSEVDRQQPNKFDFEIVTINGKLSSRIFPDSDESNSDWERLLYDISNHNFEISSGLFTPNGTFMVTDPETPIRYITRSAGTEVERKLDFRSLFPSILIVPFTTEFENACLIILKCRRDNAFDNNTAEKMGGVAQNLGVALVHRYAQISLRERVKELTCLYGLAKIVGLPDITQDKMLQGAVELLPSAWLYPEVTTARIVLDGNSFTAAGYGPGKATLTADIIVAGIRRGMVEVIYKEEMAPLDEGPFLTEERHLIDTVAAELALIIERRQSQKEKLLLQDQLRHADRLATIGQLAAGVAHELNEPLGSILGFAQLVLKAPGLHASIEPDLKKIINASLHAREVIKKLMVFARQMPPQKTMVNLNTVAEEGLYFLEARCAKSGIEVVREYAESLPEIVADPAQLHQVLINLVVNAVQAMPNGGRLTIKTEPRDGHVALIVSDTGTGMTPDILRKIFVPFFTTKDVHEGTGLGLSVVHGIVTSHRGSISVESKPGAGSRFEVHLPVGETEAMKESEENG